IVIVVKKLRSPTYVWETHRGDPGGIGDIDEIIVTLVPVESVVLVCKVGYEQVQFSVVIVVGDGDAHTPLLASVLVDRRAGLECDILERSVSVVLIKEIRRRIIRDKQIHKAILIKVAGNHAQAVEPVRVRNTGLFRYIRKGAVA